MPLLKVTTSVPVAEDKRRKLLTDLSKLVAGILGKPEEYMMVGLEEAALMMGGEEAPAAFVDLRSIGGLSREVNGEIAAKLCALLESSLGIAPDRVYINFSDVKAADWGWKGETFG
jgi:phenylpyruvate tautomerase